jgi:hypothetical protein
MRRSRRLNCVFNYLFSVCIGGWLFASVGFAAVEDSRFDISADGASVNFDVRDVPRHEVLDRLFSSQGIKLEWQNRAVADELVSGTFRGTPSAVARQLLAPTNFVVFYDRADGETRITRVSIFGRAVAGQASFGLAALEAGMKPTQKPPGSAPEAKARTKAMPVPTPIPASVAGQLPVPFPSPAPVGLAAPQPSAMIPSFDPAPGTNATVPLPKP